MRSSQPTVIIAVVIDPVSFEAAGLSNKNENTACLPLGGWVWCGVA